MNIRKSLLLFVVFLMPYITVWANESERYQIPSTQVIAIADTQANKQYELLIKLPESYQENKDKTYPVIYFTDAVWHIELLSSISAFMMEDVILVGISWQKDIEKSLIAEHGEYVSRFRDYSFRKSSDPVKQAKYKLGQANNHLAFIQKDVFNYVEKNYRTKTDNRSYFGFSSGGLFGTYVLMTQPETFKNYLLGSPSLWRLSELAAMVDLQNKKLNANVFVSYGALEEKLKPHIDDFISLMSNRNDKTLTLERVEIKSAGHSDSSPMMAVRSIKWLAELENKGEK